MKKKEIKKLSKEQSIKEYDKMKKELFNIRFQKINEIKRNIARLKTLIGVKNA